MTTLDVLAKLDAFDRRRAIALRISHGDHPTDSQFEMVRIRTFGRETSIGTVQYDDDSDAWFHQQRCFSSA